jgi:uncharacterized membrane protein YGL010W
MKPGNVKKFIQHVVPAVVKPLHVLWNEIIGFLFVVLALLLIRPVWRSLGDYGQSPAHMLKMALTVFFCLLMAGFGIQSFFKARKIRKS